MLINHGCRASEGIGTRGKSGPGIVPRCLAARGEVGARVKLAPLGVCYMYYYMMMYSLQLH